MDFGLILEAIMKVSLSQAKDRTSFFALNSALPWDCIGKQGKVIATLCNQFQTIYYLLQHTQNLQLFLK